MKVGLLGEAGTGQGAAERLREALEFLVGDVGVERVLYLGLDDAIDRVVARWRADLFGGHDGGDAFLHRLAALAPTASAEALEALLEADRLDRRLAGVHKLGGADECAVEMLEGRIVIAVFDKARLTEEDIANAQLLVYGRSAEPLLRRFGPRVFYTPGPLDAGEIGVVEALESGEMSLATFDPSGTPLGREELHGPQGTKLVVT